MSHGSNVYHERGRPKIINRAGRRLCTRSLNHVLKLGDRKLPVRLTQRNQANSGRDQIRDVALKESWQCHAKRSAFVCKTDSENNSNGQRNLSFTKYFREGVQSAIRPYLFEYREACRSGLP
jgi:hypothetical protein